MRIQSLFTVPEGEKVTEKAFGKVLLSSVCSILLCMACLMGTTWAWFRADLENKENLIQTADVQDEVIVGNPAVDPQNGVYTLAPGSYRISLKVTSNGSREDDFGLKNVYMTMMVGSGTSAVSEDPSTPSTAPAVSAAPKIYTFCMPFGEQDSNGYRFAAREITLNVSEETQVTFQLSWVKPINADLVVENPAVIGDPPAAGNSEEGQEQSSTENEEEDAEMQTGGQEDAGNTGETDSSETGASTPSETGSSPEPSESTPEPSSGPENENPEPSA